MLIQIKVTVLSSNELYFFFLNQSILRKKTSVLTMNRWRRRRELWVIPLGMKGRTAHYVIRCPLTKPGKLELFWLILDCLNRLGIPSSKGQDHFGKIPVENLKVNGKILIGYQDKGQDQSNGGPGLRGLHVILGLS